MSRVLNNDKKVPKEVWIRHSKLGLGTELDSRFFSEGRNIDLKSVYYFPHYRHHIEERRTASKVSSRRRLQSKTEEARQIHEAERRLTANENNLNILKNI